MIELEVTTDQEIALEVCSEQQIPVEVKEQIIYGGGGITPVGTKTIEVTENGTVTEDVTYYADVEVDVNVPNTYSVEDEGKVVDDGSLVSQTARTVAANNTYDTTTNNSVTVAVPASAVDSGTKNISSNGTHDVVGYANASVSVPNTYTAGDEGKVVSDGALVPQTSAEYTENGTYDTTLVSSVEVSVPGDTPTGTKEIDITENGTTTESVAGYAYAEIEVDVPNTYSQEDEGKVVEQGELVSQSSATYTYNDTYDTTLIKSVTVNVSGGSPTLETVTKTYTPTESTQTEQITPSSGYDGLAEVDVTVNAIPSGYVGSGVTRRDSTDLSASGDTVTVPAGYYEESANKAVAAGTAGTPTATKGTVSNHSVSVTPSVTNSAGYIASETKTGTAVTVSASELVSGSETKTENGTYDVTNLAELVVNVSGGGAGMTTLVDTTLTSDQTSDIQYNWSPGYEEIQYSIYVPQDARNTVGSQELIIYTENSTANQPRFNITANANTNQLNWGHMTADLLQLIKGNVSVGGATHDATGGVTATFCQQGRTGKITRFWLLYNASRFLPSGSQIKIYGR